MKSIRVFEFGDPGVLRETDIPAPLPGPQQITVRIKAAGVNPVDTYIRSGRYRRTVTFPYTPGFDGAGIIQAVGPDVTSRKIGERVFVAGSLTGTYAEECLCDTDQVFPLPDHISFEQGAAVGIPYATAYRTLVMKALAAAGETVLIHGASGGVGNAAIQVARMIGMRIIGTAGSAAGLDLVTRLGATYRFDHHHTDYLKDILAVTGGKGADVILEMLADVNLSNDLKILAAPRARIIIIGSRGEVTIDPRDAMTREIVIMGFLLMTAPPDERRKVYDEIVAGLQTRRLDPVIGKVFPLAEVRRAHEAVMQPGAFGKIVLIP